MVIFHFATMNVKNVLSKGAADPDSPRFSWHRSPFSGASEDAPPGMLRKTESRHSPVIHSFPQVIHPFQQLFHRLIHISSILLQVEKKRDDKPDIVCYHYTVQVQNKRHSMKRKPVISCLFPYEKYWKTSHKFQKNFRPAGSSGVALWRALRRRWIEKSLLPQGFFSSQGRFRRPPARAPNKPRNQATVNNLSAQE